MNRCYVCMEHYENEPQDEILFKGNKILSRICRKCGSISEFTKGIFGYKKKPHGTCNVSDLAHYTNIRKDAIDTNLSYHDIIVDKITIPKEFLTFLLDNEFLTIDELGVRASYFQYHNDGTMHFSEPRELIKYNIQRRKEMIKEIKQNIEQYRMNNGILKPSDSPWHRYK
ncbi:MAG: hypothetical protein U9N59_00085 [Campylobacterota bacterium]|nr:hypothetical protein [Campylobacterota bacterium]